jgi:hypothetical protein
MADMALSLTWGMHIPHVRDEAAAVSSIPAAANMAPLRDDDPLPFP